MAVREQQFQGRGEINGVPIEISPRFYEDERQLAVFFRQYPNIAVTEHYILRVAGEGRIWEETEKVIKVIPDAFLAAVRDKDFANLTHLIVSLPYYMVYEKEVPEGKAGKAFILDEQFLEKAILKLVEMEESFVAEEKLTDFLNADKGIRIEL